MPCSRSPGGSAPRGMSTLRGGACSGGEGSAPGGSALGGACSRGVCGDPPKADCYCCRWYASYWNVFLLEMTSVLMQKYMTHGT